MLRFWFTGKDKDEVRFASTNGLCEGVRQMLSLGMDFTNLLRVEMKDGEQWRTLSHSAGTKRVIDWVVNGEKARKP